MPGIVGLVTRRSPREAERQVSRMVETLHHETFYVTDTWADARLGIYLGWSARKDAAVGGMPLTNETGDVSLVFSGEDYPDEATVSGLRTRGHRVDPEGPSHLPHVYEDDPAFLARLNGRFHGVLADRRRGIGIVFNDRFGMHRLYYHQAAEGLYVAAEAKAILAVRPELRCVDERGLGEFVTCGCVLENRTIFRGIHTLPPASAWLVRGGTIQAKTTYFTPREWEEQEALEPAAYHAALRGALAAAVPRYFGSRDEIALALTGGLDTRLLLTSRRPAPHTLPCYTFGGMFRDSRDVTVARQVAATCQQSHVVITVGARFLSSFPSYAERTVYLTDGCVDLSRASDLYVSERAREIAPVKIVGTYGSELVSPAPTFGPVMPEAGVFSGGLTRALDAAVDTYAGARRVHPVTFAAFRQSPWAHYGVMALEQTQLNVRAPYLDNAFVRTVYRAPVAGAADIRRRLIAEADPVLGALPTDRGVSSGARLSAVLARLVLEAGFKADHAYDYALPRWLAGVDRLLRPMHLERWLLGRYRITHFRIWYRDALAGYVREMLLDRRALSRPYVQRAGIERLVRTHLDGRRNHTIDLHRILTLELLHRVFIDA